MFSWAGALLSPEAPSGTPFQPVGCFSGSLNHLPQHEQATGTSSSGGMATRYSQQHSCTAHLQHVLGNWHWNCCLLWKMKHEVPRPLPAHHTASVQPFSLHWLREMQNEEPKLSMQASASSNLPKRHMKAPVEQQQVPVD